MNALGICFAIFFFSSVLLAEQEELASAHFVLKGDQQLAQSILRTAEKCAEKLARDFQQDLSGSIKITVYPNCKALHEAIARPDAPDWLVGHYSLELRTISIVSPLNPGTQHTYESIFRTLHHQITNAFIFDVCTAQVPAWLRIGLAMRESGQSANIPACETIPTVEELEDPCFEFLVRRNGFTWSYYFVAFLDFRYGWDKVLELARDYSSFEEILGISKAEFRSQLEKWML